MKANECYYKAALLTIMSCISLFGLSQTPQGFSYQAVVRDAAGIPIGSKTVGVQITLEDASHVAHYTETHTPTTNAQGVIFITIGKGTVVGIKTFESVPWSTGDVYLKLEVDPNGGSNYTQVGNSTKLQAVPYALYAENTKEVVSLPTALDDDPIFVVKNKAGQIVFAVYQTGVRVYVEDSPIIKGARGGFAVGGLSQTKAGIIPEYFRITPDSARIYTNKTTVKGARGGFAVGGLSQTKAVAEEYLQITPDSARIYINNSPIKGARGGFAVGGLSQTKGSISNYMQLTPKNYFIGHRSGLNNLTGSENIFLGYESGLNNSGGTNNILVGYQSGYNIFNGGFNILLGYKSGFSLQNGSDNIFLGFESGYNSISSGNMFLGFRSGYSNTIGNFNIFVGTNTAYWNSTGAKNTYIGYTCGVKNSTGNQNAFYGYESGVLNETGSDNTFIGTGSGYHNIIGTGNVYIGSGSGQNVNGSGNIFIGSLAGSQSNPSTNNRLIIHNNNSTSPLIYGEFDNSKVKLNASVNIRDFMVLEPQTSAPASPVKGTVYFNGTDNKMYCWNGTAWMALY